VIFRPLHEHTQTWNWWGRSATTDSEFIAFWRFIVSYLRDTKGIHNVIYAISPQMDEVYDDPVGRILFRWPGDEWVDLVGIDCYHGRNRKAFESNVKALAEVSERVHKPVGVTETGWKTTTTPTIGRTMYCLRSATVPVAWSWHGATTIPATPTGLILPIRRRPTSSYSLTMRRLFLKTTCPTCTACPRA
jgi:hypothetical protein